MRCHHGSREVWERRNACPEAGGLARCTIMSRLPLAASLLMYAACGGGGDRGSSGSSPDGGAADGGVADGGVADGGAADAGAADGGEASSTCETLADPTLCWAVAVADLYACVPDEPGVLSADRTACTFSDGTEIEFPEPLPTSDASYLPALTVLRPDGSVCATFSESSGVRRVTAAELTATFSQEPGPVLTLRCDGEVVFSDSFSDVIDCASEGVPLPSWSAELDETSASLEVRAVGQSGPLFECMTAP